MFWHVLTCFDSGFGLESRVFRESLRGGRKMVAGSAGCRECWHVNPFPTSRGGTELCSLGRVAYIWKSSPPHTIHTQKIIAPFNSFPTHGTHSDSSQSIHNRTGADMCWQWLLTGVPTNLEHCANMQMLEDSEIPEGSEGNIVRAMSWLVPSQTRPQNSVWILSPRNSPRAPTHSCDVFIARPEFVLQCCYRAGLESCKDSFPCLGPGILLIAHIAWGCLRYQCSKLPCQAFRLAFCNSLPFLWHISALSSCRGPFSLVTLCTHLCGSPSWKRMRGPGSLHQLVAAWFPSSLGLKDSTYHSDYIYIYIHTYSYQMLSEKGIVSAKKQHFGL